MSKHPLSGSGDDDEKRATKRLRMESDQTLISVWSIIDEDRVECIGVLDTLCGLDQIKMGKMKHAGYYQVLLLKDVYSSWPCPITFQFDPSKIIQGPEILGAFLTGFRREWLSIICDYWGHSRPVRCIGCDRFINFYDTIPNLCCYHCRGVKCWNCVRNVELKGPRDMIQRAAEKKAFVCQSIHDYDQRSRTKIVLKNQRKWWSTTR
jgi:hypothetical protein